MYTISTSKPTYAKFHDLFGNYLKHEILLQTEYLADFISFYWVWFCIDGISINNGGYSFMESGSSCLKNVRSDKLFETALIETCSGDWRMTEPNVSSCWENIWWQLYEQTGDLVIFTTDHIQSMIIRSKGIKLDIWLIWTRRACQNCGGGCRVT